MNLKGKHILTLGELSSDDIFGILSKAIEIKINPDKFANNLKSKTVALLFSKPSTRTRVSFEAGVSQLGGTSIYLSPDDLQIGRGESIEDTARVLSTYVDIMVIRTFKQTDVETYAKFSSVPVINGLTDEFHPCQALADLMTVYEIKGSFKGTRLAYIGDGNNVANSLVIGSAITGMSLSVATPAGYEVNDTVLGLVKEKFGYVIETSNSPEEAVRNADFVYTDVWTSMGQEKEKDKRLKDFDGFQINDELIKFAAPNAKVLHCLPAHRGEEISGEVLEGENSAVWQQAGNRLHVQKALMLYLLGRQ